MTTNAICPDLIIVGAGIVGLSTALSAARQGATVKLIECKSVGAGASAVAGALVRGNCSTPFESRLAKRSLAIFEDWQNIVGGNAGFHQVGVLELVDEHGVDALKSRTEMQASVGVPVYMMDKPRFVSAYPSLKLSDIHSATFHSDGGVCEPVEVLRSLYRAAQAAGVQFALGVTAIELIAEKSRCIGVSTHSGKLHGGAVLVAAGTGAARLLGPSCAQFGLYDHQSVLAVFHDQISMADVPVVLDQAQNAWFRPMADGGLLVGMDLTQRPGVPRHCGDLKIESIHKRYLQAAVHRFGISPWAACRGIWWGKYVRSKDDLPIIGKHPALQDAYVAVGDSGGAFKLAPALGADLSGLIISGTSNQSDIAPFAPDRLPLESHANAAQ